jgi:hypothetical protein
MSSSAAARLPACLSALHAEFKDHGAVKAEIMMDKITQRSRGFGFVYFQRWALLCIECYGLRFFEQRLAPPSPCLHVPVRFRPTRRRGNMQQQCADACLHFDY